MYMRHIRDGHPPCDACRTANTEYYRRRREIKRLEDAILVATSQREIDELERQRRALFTPRERARWEREQQTKMDALLRDLI